MDGITSTVILGAPSPALGGDVTHFIPERIRDGYGLQVPAVERLHAEGVRLIISVDCGIRSLEAATRAAELGVDLVITDHHEPEAELPRAVAVLNPKRLDCRYPDKNLAGVGVALKLVQALCARTGHEKWLPAFVKIAALGTLADVVPLVGENRVIAKIGLDLLSRGPHKVGLRALLDVAGLSGKTIDSYNVGVRPRPPHQRGRPDGDARHRGPPAAGDRRRRWRTRRARWPSSSTRRTSAGRRRSRRSSRKPAASSRATRTSAPTRCWSSPAKAGTAA